MKKIAVILSGSGVFDGAEIHETVLALLAIEQEGASWHCFAPNIDQYHVINHLTGKETTETRNVLIEAARIARGNIEDIVHLKPIEYDALLLPGGFGVAKNLSNFAIKGEKYEINPDVKSLPSFCPRRKASSVFMYCTNHDPCDLWARSKRYHWNRS